jgi:hypothetical protein
VLNPTQPPISAAPPQRQSDPPASFSSRQGPPPSFGTTPSPQQTHASQSFNSQGPPPASQHHERSFSSQGQPLQQYNSGSMGSMGSTAKEPPSHGSYNTGSITSSSPPQISSLPFQTSPTLQPSFPQQQVAPPTHSQPPATSNGVGYLPPPLKPVFGISLDQLFERDSSAVPMVVYQCIQAVDLFGLEVEGIYRLSGTASHITKIRAMFDNGKLHEYHPLVLHANHPQMHHK